MSTEQLDNFEQLGRRAIACKNWKWLGGMRVVSPAEHSGATGYTVRVESGYVAKAGEYPDLTDPATLGCLLALVREAWHTDSWHTRLGVDGWEVRDTYTTIVDGKPAAIVCGMDWKSRGGAIDPNGAHGSEIEALVAALEAAQ